MILRYLKTENILLYTTAIIFIFFLKKFELKIRFLFKKKNYLLLFIYIYKSREIFRISNKIILI